MGNCMQSGGPGGHAHRKKEEEEEGQQGGAPPPAVVTKVKMVVTKGELGWLVARLRAGDRRLEDVLREMARNPEGGRAGGGWRPSLESILECPETTATAGAEAGLQLG